MHDEGNNEVVDVLRRQNRTLRRINSILRSVIIKQKDYADNLFLQLCEQHELQEAVDQEEDQ